MTVSKIDSPGWASPIPIQVREWSAAGVLTLYLFLLIAIPSDQVFAPLGGAGAPANLLGVVFLGYYLFRLLHPVLDIGCERLAIRSAALMFLFVFLASYAVVNLHSMTSLGRNADDRGLISVAGWLGVFLLGAYSTNDLVSLMTLLRRLVFGVTALALVGDVQFVIGRNLASYIDVPGLTLNAAFIEANARDSYNRPQATAAHPLEFAYVLAVVLPIAIHLARYAPREKRRLRWVQAAVIGLTLPLTVSRSGLIGLAIAVIVIIPVWPRRERRRAFVVIAISFLGIEAAVPGLLHTVQNLFFAIGSDSSTTSRTGALSNAVPLIAQHPFLGSGFGTFSPQIFFFTDDQYLHSAIEIGLIGVLALISLFVSGCVSSWRARCASSDPEIRHLAQCMLASCGVILCVSATFDILSFAMAVGVSFFMLGCVGALRRITMRESLAHSG